MIELARVEAESFSWIFRPVDHGMRESRMPDPSTDLNERCQRTCQIARTNASVKVSLDGFAYVDPRIATAS